MIKPRKRPPPTDAPAAIKKNNHRLLTMIGLQYAEISTPTMVAAAGERNADTGTGTTCVRSLAITEQIAQGRGVMQSKK